MRLINYGTILFTLLLIPLLCSCEQNSTEKTPSTTAAAGNDRPPASQDDRVPPTPPIKETFDDQPQLSLFPRVGDYQPDSEDERYPFWRTFIDHFTKTSGLLQEPESGNKAWSFRGIKSIDSVAYFSPIAVTPDTTYRISYKVKTELPEGAKSGIGILEFDKFLWVGEQYSEKTVNEHLLGSQIGVELIGDIDWEEKEFNLVTGPKTRMIHLVFYREGEHSRKPVLFDDVEIKESVISNQ